ncbi:hypothetical protein GE09DRAFT_1159092 [Coniochaeta sp. 2T2.1]|nr:hypothetical protein GE09DRAFT_1159092 [Coniochaeta sp. 2T2.1]
MKGTDHSREQSWDDKKWPMVRIPADIQVLFALPSQDHPEPYYYMKAGQPLRMNRVLKQLCTAGRKVEDGILKAKELLRNGENPDVMRHALGIYLTHSSDAQDRHLTVPALKDHAVMRAQATIQPSSSTSQIDPGEVTTPDTLRGPAVLSYWREDYDYNDHHVHWHMVFPGTGTVVDGQNVKVIDRQGELFLYMHSQMVARYDTEGLCWGLPLVRPWNQYDDVLEQGYVPVPPLKDFYGGYGAYSSWFATKNPTIPDTKDEPVSRAQLEQWRDNVYQAIKNGYFLTKKPDGSQGKAMLDPGNCANLVGVVIEAESAALQVLPDGSSLDSDVYGNIHNFGHDKFAEMGYHNYLTKDNPYSLMISNFGSPRDAAFWPWHKHIQYYGRLAAARFPQDVTEHKANVSLSNLIVKAQKTGPGHPDGIVTVMGPPAVNLMESRAKLDHEPYEWSVEIQSHRTPSPSTDNPQTITLRMFIAAKELMEDYHSWIEMDKATISLTSASTTQVRLDTDSAVARKMGNYSELNTEWASSWCRCGWPQNMMLPVGRVEGMEFVAFCMATDDVVDASVKTPAVSYCGSMQADRKYPDPRGMGYPFNQEWTQNINTGGVANLSTIIADNKTYPFMATSSFRVFRTTKPFVDTMPGPSPIRNITWFDPIKAYFQPGDVVCMVHEYGYDLSDYNDVVLHGAAIYDAVLHKRMPLQMSPYTQEKPDPKHPMWTDDMCHNFNAWLQSGCPKGQDPGPGPHPGPTPSDVTWDGTIKGYFLPSDVKCMTEAGGFDLSKKDDVVKYADAIYKAVVDGGMPMQMKPYSQKNPDPNHPLWTTQMCNNFKAWKNGNFP